MKDVDKMMKKARALLAALTCALLCDNEDGFLDALCVNPEKYKRTAPDGAEGYDFLAALMDTARTDWSAEKVPEEPEGVVEMETPSEKQEIEPAEEKLLEESPVEEVTSPKKKVKYRNLFGWG